MDDLELNKNIKNFKKNGDKLSYEKIYRHYMPKIYRYVFLKLRDKHTSEDITSEVFIRVFKNLRIVNLNAVTFKIWLYKISRNILIDFYRAKNRQSGEISIDDFELSDDLKSDLNNKLITEDPINDNSLDFENPNLIEAIAELPELQREVITLRYTEELNYRVIGKIINKNEIAVRAIKFRALVNLKDKMEKKNG
jgi:RNA polymerase sigma-70 factor (ECF subfamily)